MFISYRIRPVIEHMDPDGEVSYSAAASLADAEREINEFCARGSFSGREGKDLLWGIYGVNPPENGVSTEDAISDTVSLESAKQLLAKIIGPFTMDTQGYCALEPIAPSQGAPISLNTPPEGMDYWKDQDESHPVSDWEIEVANGDTRAGYWEWAFSARRCDADCEGLQTERSSSAEPATPSGKRIMARFIPEAWINDCAVEVDGSFEFDVTEQVLAMSESERASLRDDSHESDKLVPSGILANYSGPYRVEIEDAIAEYFSEPVQV